MKKDIIIPKVTDIELAIVFEYNEIYKEDDWNVYLINNKNIDLELVVIVSQGFSKTKTTSLFRKKIDNLPANSFAKIEVMPTELFALDNRFQVTFFENNTLFEKTFLFEANTISESKLKLIAEIDKNGIIAG